MAIPILKWPGGKAKLAAKIDEKLGPARGGRYIEPFCGACAVFLHRQAVGRITPGRAELSDLNVNLVLTLRTMKLHAEAVHHALRVPSAFPVKSGWERGYYETRDGFNVEFERLRVALERDNLCGVNVNVKIQRAATMIWLNRACFNGLWRENASGGMNSPVGRYDELTLPTRSTLLDFAAAMEGAGIQRRQFMDVLADAREGDVVYCDPPYAPLSKTASFTSYSRGGFGWNDQVMLAEAAAEAVRRGARVVLSNHATPEILDLYRHNGFEIEVFEVKRSISCKGEGRGKKIEEILAFAG